MLRIVGSATFRNPTTQLVIDESDYPGTSYQAGIRWLQITTNQPCSVQVRSRDNDVPMSATMYLGPHPNRAGELFLPITHDFWFLSPVDDGVELYFLSLASGATNVTVQWQVGVEVLSSNYWTLRDQETL